MSVFGFKSTYAPSFMNQPTQQQMGGSPMQNPLYSSAKPMMSGKQESAPGMPNEMFFSPAPTANQGNSAAPLESNPFHLNFQKQANSPISDPGYKYSHTNRERVYDMFGVDQGEKVSKVYQQESWKNPYADFSKMWGEAGFGDVKFNNAQELHKAISNLSIDQLSRMNFGKAKSALDSLTQSLSNSYANKNFANQQMGGERASKDTKFLGNNSSSLWVTGGELRNDYTASNGNFGLGNLNSQLDWLQKAYNEMVQRADSAHLF